MTDALCRDVKTELLFMFSAFLEMDTSVGSPVTFGFCRLVSGVGIS